MADWLTGFFGLGVAEDDGIDFLGNPMGNPILLVVPNQQIHDENMEFHEFSTWDLEYDPC